MEVRVRPTTATRLATPTAIPAVVSHDREPRPASPATPSPIMSRTGTHQERCRSPIGRAHGEGYDPVGSVADRRVMGSDYDGETFSVP